jgi:hypothetical protein
MTFVDNLLSCREGLAKEIRGEWLRYDLDG